MPDYWPEEGWRAAAACGGMALDPDFDDIFFPAHGGGFAGFDSGVRARGICTSCPVQRECLLEALDMERGVGKHNRRDRSYPFGIWGGLTARQRHKDCSNAGRTHTCPDIESHADDLLAWFDDEYR